MENTKAKKPIFKKWWFWVVIVIVIIAIVAGASGGDSDNGGTNTTAKTEAKVETEAKITYNQVDLQEMIDALSANALKAEKTYQDMYVEVEGKIKNFDSDGSYVTIEPVNADEWNFDTAMCYIKDEIQEEFLLEKSVGDTITVQGQVTSIGEVLGYSINIDTVK